MPPGRPVHAAPTPDDATLTRAADAIRAGQLVAFPTETVYGLGANAIDPTAVANVFHVKSRPHFDPLIVHVADADHARQFTAHWPEIAQRLAEAFWPGPLTLVLPKLQVQMQQPPSSKGETSIPDLVTAGLPTVALRVPAHPVALALIRRANRPIAAPSANRFGGVSPTTADHVRDELGDQVSFILDGGPCRTGVESTVLSLVEPGRPRILRLGGLPVETLEQAIGPIEQTVPQAANPEAERRGQASPGMLERHYAPRTPLCLVDQIVSSIDGVLLQHEKKQTLQVALVVHGRAAEQAKTEIRNPPFNIKAVESLSPAGDLVEAAANLFAVMRRLDAMGLDLIVAERVPDIGVGRAINDRLRRASTRGSC